MKDGQGFAKRVTRGNLSTFAPLLKKPRAASTNTDNDDDEDEDQANTATPPDPAAQAAEALFKGKRVSVSRPLSRRTQTGKSTGRRSQTPLSPTDVPTKPNAEPKIVFRWSKNLSASDVNKNPKSKRNLLSLGKGRGKAAARVMQDIDDIRNKMMADEDWESIQISGEDAEIVSISVEVRFPGQQPTPHKLEFVHAPHRGSKQFNYHTSIRWDAELAKKLRDAGKTGFTGFWAVLDKYDTGKYVLMITANAPTPRSIGLK